MIQILLLDCSTKNKEKIKTILYILLRKEFKIFKFFSKILSLLSLPKKFISNKKKIFLTNIQNIKKKRDRLYKLKTKKNILN